MLCHLAETAAPVGAVTKANAREWLEYFENSRTNHDVIRPKTHLMTLPDLLKAVRKSGSAGGNSNTEGIAISDAELCWLWRFNEEVRNQFVHFEPMSLSIEVSGIPEIAKLIARIIQDILEIGWAFRHQDIAEREEMERSLKALALIEWPG